MKTNLDTKVWNVILFVTIVFQKVVYDKKICMVS